MATERAFLEVPRQDPAYRPVPERVRDYRWVELPLSERDIRTQATRCMSCGIPFCHTAHSGCSLRNIIPEINAQAARGRWKEALDLLLHTHPFPEFTGRVCPAPCESACVLGLIQPPVTICKIELAVIEQGFQRGYVQPQPPSRTRPERVAVVGSGPAGLAAAQLLRRAGLGVTVYETAPKPGGLLRYGIPDFKLEKWVLDRRLALMRQEGVVFECGLEAGVDISCRYLQQRYQAIVLAGGARQPRDLNVPGRELEGIYFALDYLTQQNQRVSGEPLSGQPAITAEGKNVVVIGGGDTGADCIGTAIRQGARQVVQLEILPEPPPTRAPTTPWPLWPYKRRDSSSHEEGRLIRRWSVSPTAFSGENGQVRFVHAVQVRWEPDAQGKPPQPKPIEGSEFTLEAELVLLAMGFVAPGRCAIADDLGLKRDPRGFLWRDDRHMTSADGVFVAGDMHRGASLVVHAIADGVQTARHLIRWFNLQP